MNERLTKRCTGAGYVFGFSTSFASFEVLIIPRSLALVRPPGDLGRYAAQLMMLDDKEQLTLSIRDAIRLHAPSAIETDRAACGTIELSYQCSEDANRCVWISVGAPAFPLEEVGVDLEDTNFDGKVDHTVACISFPPTKILSIANAVQLWFAGAPWEDVAAMPDVRNVRSPNGNGDGAA